MSRLIILPAACLLAACAAYQPIAMVSKVDDKVYQLNYSSSSENGVRQVLDKDAKGICKDEQKKKYYKIVEEKVEYVGAKVENDKKGIAGAVTQLSINKWTKKSDDWKGTFKFECQ